MIDLISHGLALRKHHSILVDVPQSFRSISAGEEPHLIERSAESSKSAMECNKNYVSDFSETIVIAKNADRAEYQCDRYPMGADCVRKDSGLKETSIIDFLSFKNKPPQNSSFVSWSDLFKKAEQSRIELLFDDRRWLESLGHYRVSPIFDEYIRHWILGMQEEDISFKKQNAGRYKANTFMREMTS